MPEFNFTYVAVDSAGRRARGTIAAADDGAAFASLRGRGLSPISIRPAPAGHSNPRSRASLPDRQAAELLDALAHLLGAGADIRTALTILEQKQAGARSSTFTNLNKMISGGSSLDQAFASVFHGGQAFVVAIVSAAEAAGDLPAGLGRAAGILEARLRLRSQLISTLSYPAFVAMSALLTVGVILLFVVPAIEPMAEDSGTTPPFALHALIMTSHALRDGWREAAAAFAVLLLGLLAASRLGLVERFLDWLLLDGPLRRWSRGIVYGRYASALGSMLAGGASMVDALRLASQCVRSRLAVARLEKVSILVRQGEPISVALERAAGFPPSIIRLAAVGEASNSLGDLLRRAGELEEQSALAKVEASARLAGPIVIIALGLMLGALMAGLLSGITGLGQAALQ